MTPCTLPGPTFADILATGHVRRWHTKPEAAPQTLADHLGKVALLADRLGRHLPERYDDAAAHETLLWALCHDLPETEHGDIPNPAKRWLNNHLLRPYDEMVAEDWWRDRGEPAPEPSALPLALVQVADILEAATRYWTYGLDAEVKLSIVSEVGIVTRRVLPELLPVVALALEAAGVSRDLLAELAA